jgi:hypothetical protein
MRGTKVLDFVKQLERIGKLLKRNISPDRDSKEEESLSVAMRIALGAAEVSQREEQRQEKRTNCPQANCIER